jgi:hypothetical protein
MDEYIEWRVCMAFCVSFKAESQDMARLSVNSARINFKTSETNVLHVITTLGNLYYFTSLNTPLNTKRSSL